MKTIKLSLIALFALILNSCEINEYPYGIYSKENLFSTKDGAQSVVLSTYRALCPWEITYLQYYVVDMTTDVAFNNRLDDVPYPEFSEWKLELLKDNVWNQNMFKAYYKVIHNACDGIESLPAVTWDGNERDRLLGESYFMRGYGYYMLGWLYGRVPMKLSTSDAFPKMAANLDEVYSQIISDLTKAEQLMPIKRSPGTADRVAAWSLLAKTYLTIASAKESGTPGYAEMSFDVADCYAKSAEWAKKVVDNPEQNIYYLDPSLADVYDVTKQNGPEHIFFISHYRESGLDAEYSKIPRFFFPNNNGNPYYVKNSAGNYDITIDGWSSCAPSEEWKQQIQNASANDKRYLDLIKKEYYVKEGDGSYKAISMSPQDATHYDFCAKYIDPIAAGTERTSVQNIILRVADIMLVYAEALGKTNGLEWLNKVTARAGGKTYQVGDFADDAAFRAAVLQERAFELAFEAKRLEDLRRTNNVRNKVHGKIAPSRPNLDLSGYTDEQLTFYPIPQREIDLNPNI